MSPDQVTPRTPGAASCKVRGMLVVRRRRRIFGQWEKNTNNAFHRMLNLMDPYPMKRYQSLTYTQVQAVLDAHDEEREVLMKARLDEFSESFLRMTFYEQPRRPRRASKHIAPVRRPELLAPPTIMGFSKKTIAARIRAEGAGTVDALLSQLVARLREESRSSRG